MQPLIPPRAYSDLAVFQEEQRRIFATTWQFAGFTHELERSQDYVTTTVGGRSVVIQNFGGELRAFANVCSHRFARLRLDQNGNGPLRCPYHGWIYNEQGIPYSIPSRPRFADMTRDVLEGLRLRTYDVDTCGPLVFVRGGHAPGGPSLRAYLGVAADVLESFGHAMGAYVEPVAVTFEANWKVVVENALEAYHVGFVHQNSFQKLGAKGMTFRFDGPHSSWTAPVNDETASQTRKLLALYRAPAYGAGYFHQYVFPNLAAVTLAGTSFGIQRFEPVSPAETRLTNHIFQPRSADGGRVNAAMLEVMNRSSADFARQVFEEDRVVCRAAQLGLAETDKPGILSYEEERVWRFQEAYVAAMAAPSRDERAAEPASPRVECSGEECAQALAA